MEISSHNNVDWRFPYTAVKEGMYSEERERRQGQSEGVFGDRAKLGACRNASLLRRPTCNPVTTRTPPLSIAGT